MATPISQMLSHWQHYFKDFNISSNKFYAKVEQVLNEQKMPNSKIFRINRKEGGILSASREYLRVQHASLIFDICAAPFGTNFFISWWLYETEGTMQILFKSTRVGNYLKQRAARRTLYEIDEETMFKECVHNCILDALDDVTQKKGFKLTETERKIKELAP